MPFRRMKIKKEGREKDSYEEALFFVFEDDGSKLDVFTERYALWDEERKILMFQVGGTGREPGGVFKIITPERVYGAVAYYELGTHASNIYRIGAGGAHFTKEHFLKPHVFELDGVDYRKAVDTVSEGIFLESGSKSLWHENPDMKFEKRVYLPEDFGLTKGPNGYEYIKH